MQRLYGPFCADFFASDCSFRMKPYFARFASGELEGVDAFSVLWEGRRGYEEVQDKGYQTVH